MIMILYDHRFTVYIYIYIHVYCFFTYTIYIYIDNINDTVYII